MRILLLSDVHANIWALEAILSEEKNFDLLCCAGDLVDWGIKPSEVISRIKQFQNMRIVYGNHDRYAIMIFRHLVYPESPPVYRWLNYNVDRMTEEEIEYLENLPAFDYFMADEWAYLMHHQYIPDTYKQIETSDQFEAFWKEHTPEEYWDMPKKRVIFGHSHLQDVYQISKGMECLNPGSISYQRGKDIGKGAQYITIQDGEVEMHTISYDDTPLIQEAVHQLHTKGIVQSELQLYFANFGKEDMYFDFLK